MSVVIVDANNNPQTVNTLPALGQSTMATSLPVTISSDQSAISVSANALPLPAGAAKDGTDITAAIMPTGGVGIRGWLSSIYTALTGVISVVVGSPATAGNGTILGSASAAAINVAGSGYSPGEIITLGGGTLSSGGLATKLTVLTTGVISASVNNGGTGGTTGTQTVTGTTGTGTKFQASVTITSGSISAINSISLAGSYTVNPVSLTAEPVTGGGLSGATLNVVMGVNTVSISTAGSYTVVPSNPVSQSSSTGAGSGSKFNMTYAPIVTTLFGGVTPVNGWKVCNVDATNIMWVSDSTNASANSSGSFPILAQSQYKTELGEKPVGPVTVIGTTIGQQFSARRW